MHKFLALYFQL